MAFRTKIKNRLLVDERQTVDAKHNNALQSFIEQKSYLPALEEELHQIISDMEILNVEHSKCPVINMDLQKKIWKLDDRKKELETEINNIRNNTEENLYMLKTGKILSDYYKILEQEKQLASGQPTNLTASTSILSASTYNNTSSNSIQDNINSDDTVAKKKCITDWFSQSNNNPTVFENVDTGKKIVNITKKKTLNDFKSDVKKAEDKNQIKEKIENKDAVYEKYMKTVDKNYISNNNDNTDIFDTCTKCMVEMLLNNNTGILICPNCGLMENIIVDSDKPSFKEPPKEMTSFCYKRINHLNEFLAQFQAKETTDIPEDVYYEILMEIKKERITNMALITPEKMRILLKRIKKNDYYEHIPYIINQLNGLPAPVIAPEIEEIIRGMFKAIQIPFEKYCPHKRKNFLSYNYVMYKFFELLELDEYLTCFQLLKSRTKLHQQDQIWKNICKDLNWQFIRSL
jgi:predicted RNA-binding Zn-ribbon protein involved in translation (DUF1610 family)